MYTEPIFQQQGKDTQFWILRLIVPHVSAVGATLKDMKFGRDFGLTKRIEEDRGVHTVYLLIELGGVDEARAGVLRNMVYGGDDVIKVHLWA